MKKQDTAKNLPSLADEDIVTIGKDKARHIVRSGKNVTVSLALVVTGTSFFTSCSDDKECSDSDTGQTTYDTGVYADPITVDYGQATSVGDPVGSGDYCSDYD
jgi:hypothetical protein